MSTPTVPTLEPVFTIEAQIEAPRSAGPSPLGERLHIPITGGKVFGPKLEGTILPGGSDWPVIGPDGHSRIDARYTIEASDGTLIYIVNRGLRVSSSSVMQRLRAKEPVSPAEYYMRGAPIFDAPDGPHRWLAEHLFVCSIAPSSETIRIAIYQVT